VQRPISSAHALIIRAPAQLAPQFLITGTPQLRNMLFDVPCYRLLLKLSFSTYCLFIGVDKLMFEGVGKLVEEVKGAIYSLCSALKCTQNTLATHLYRVFYYHMPENRD
jgi:hypothetical protein